MLQNQSQALIHQLKIRFQRKPRRCRKINDSYIGYAQRIVSISNQTFYYYPTIQQFTDKDFDKLQYVIPKAGVKLGSILQLKFPPRLTNQRNFFSIIIPKNKILKFTKAMKQIIVDQYAQGQQTWQFNFNYDIICLPQRQQKQKQSQLKEMLKQKVKKQQLMKQKEIQQKQQKDKIQQQYNSLLQTQEMNVRQDQQYKKKRNQISQKQNKQKIVNQCDQLFFTRIYRQIQPLIQHNQHENILALAALQIKLLQVIGNFRERAELTVRQFIDQWPYTINRQVKKNSYYQRNNLQLKIGGKSLNQQFLSNLWVANTIHKCQKQLSKPLRVPLMALIKYKGFKVLVRACTPSDNYQVRGLDDSIIHGNCTDNWKSNFLIMDNLSTIADHLKLKPYNSQVHYQRVQIHLGTSLKIIQTQVDPYKQVKKLDSKLDQVDNNYQLDYLYDMGEIFPIDLDLEDDVNQNSLRLRPEFLQAYNDPQLQKTRLVGGALMYSIEDQEGEKQDVIVAKAAQHFKYVTLYKFVKNLDTLKFIPYNSQTLGQIMKAEGINMRYLGTVYKTTSLPYIKTITQVQCISRIIKSIYRHYQQQFCTQSFREQAQASRLINQAFSPNSPSSLSKVRLKQIKKLQQQHSIHNAVDYLNLIFGSSQETVAFWNIIKDKVRNQYKIQINDFFTLPHGYLLKSVLYHCGFQIKITDKLPLFTNTKSFTQQQWTKFTCKIQSFDMPDLKVYEKTINNQNFSTQKNRNHLEMKLLIRRALKKKQLDILIDLTKYKENFQPVREFYCIENLMYHYLHPSAQNFDSALKIGHFILPSSHPFFTQMYLKYSSLKTSQLDIISLKKAAQNHVIRNLGISHWKTSQIMSSIKQIQYLSNLKRAQVGVSSQSKSKLYLNIVKQEIHLGRLVQCSSYVKKAIQIFSKIDLNQQQLQDYLMILLLGMETNYKIRRIENLVKISQFMWHALEKYWHVKHIHWFQHLMRMNIKCFLQSYQRKNYLYKLVIVLKSEVQHNFSNMDKFNILLEFYQKCKQSKNHINWTKQLLIKLQFGYLQLNFKPDFFNDFWKHTKSLANEDFQQGLKEVHDLIHILGQQYFQNSLLDRIYTFQKQVDNFDDLKFHKK